MTQPDATTPTDAASGRVATDRGLSGDHRPLSTSRVAVQGFDSQRPTDPAPRYGGSEHGDHCRTGAPCRRCVVEPGWSYREGLRKALAEHRA